MEKQAKKENSVTVEVDEKDRAILQLLQDNAKLTVREIAHQVHLSPTPVHERIKRMEDSGVIRQYAALVDHSKVKKGLMIICYVSLKEHNKRSGAKLRLAASVQVSKSVCLCVQVVKILINTGFL